MTTHTLVACVDGSGHAEAALPVMVSWTRTFGGSRPWFVEVIPPLDSRLPADSDPRETQHVRAIAERLASEGIESSCACYTAENQSPRSVSPERHPGLAARGDV